MSFTLSLLFFQVLIFDLAVGLLVMMYPILCKAGSQNIFLSGLSEANSEIFQVKYETLHHVFREKEIWVQIGFSIVVNWIIAPLLMVCSPLTIPHESLAKNTEARSSMGISSRQRRTS